MADIIIKSFGELRDIVIENLKEGTVLTIDLAAKEADADDHDNG